jgi:hypothetical protein
MTKRVQGCFFCFLAFFMLGGGVMLTPTDAAEDLPLLTDAEEYAVFMAVLFPKGPDSIDPATKADLERKAFLTGHRDRLDGITGNSYNLSRFTISGTKPDKGPDHDLIGDYNRRNEHSCRLDEERLRSLVPKGGKIALVTQGEPGMTGGDILPFDGTTFISRPGFNQDLTKAIVQINHVAGPEMGVGYQVYLEKSSPGGTWVIIDSVLNRRY